MKIKEFIKKLNPEDVLNGNIAFKLYTQEWGKQWFFYCDQKEAKELYGKEWQSVEEWLDFKIDEYDCLHDVIKNCEIDVEEVIQCFVNEVDDILTYEIYYIPKQQKEN